MSELTWQIDKRADVLYMTVGEPDARARSRSDEHGFVWRTSRDGVRRGVTVQNAHAWLLKRRELEALLAEGFGIDEAVVHKELPEMVA